MSGLGQYVYDYTNSNANWQRNDQPWPRSGVTYSDPITFANPNDYDAYVTFSLLDPGGRVAQFLRTSSDGVMIGTGSYVSVEVVTEMYSYHPAGAVTGKRVQMRHWQNQAVTTTGGNNFWMDANYRLYTLCERKGWAEEAGY